ncbi:Sugar kinase of the NBD/HSP70 family, may contain an N-terminal HTH domain [Agreia bicolorata]|uniref:Sugar kinase of the NBD/HSP70 family, may contain an N-terminal HTH domain n=1 Tax=Agreia bicolorata TaxID=110935 RepID=A0A1T4XDT5_9MICO|nr:ROK family protein [Agreia bicolorata]SKA87348.1 Sugar kinase of the NBD/HSP70 family, may contain an N-terminal HTH domain [Agreia bicolorata]
MSDASRDSVIRDPARDLAREVLIHGPIARGELGRRLGLSPASLTRLSRPFLDHGILVEAPERQDGVVGRPVKPLDVRVDAQRMLGVKITGERVFGVVTDLRATVGVSETTLLAGHGVEDVLDGIQRVMDALDAHDVAAIGASIGGKVTGSSLVVRAPFLDWHDVDLGAAIEARFDRPATVENDVVALTAAEQWFGHARGIDNFSVITIGAGVGYGLVVHGRQVISSDTGLGLGGHFPLDPTGPLCADGHRGCSSAMLSIPSMCASAGVGLGRVVDYDELLALAAEGNAVARQVVDTSGRALGRLIAASANLAMVETVVLSGEGIGLLGVAEDAVHAAVRADRDPDALPVEIRRTDADFTAWARGAAAVAIQSGFGLIPSAA